MKEHYIKLKIRPFDYSMANGLDAMQHSVIKYVTRFRDKNGIEDLHKAKDVLKQLIAYEQKQFDYVDWYDVMKGFVASIAGYTESFDRIVIVPRGGMTLGHALAEALNIEKVDLYWQHKIYTGKVLLVDDIVDSGLTMTRLTSKSSQFPGTFKVAALAQRHSSSFKADFVGKTVGHDNYVVFPWEPER